MALNTHTLSGNFGPNGTHPNALTFKAIFTESVINAAAGTSTVKVVVQIVNNSDNIERRYTGTNGRIAITVAGVTQRLSGSAVQFTVTATGATKTRTIATLYFRGVNHRSGSANIGADCSYPSYTGTNSVHATGSITLNNAAAPPTPPVWTSTPAAPGAGTSTVLTWTSYENKSASGVTQISPYTSMALQVSQSSYPDHFTPFTLASDLSNVAGGSLGLSNYAVVTFWNTTLGTTLPSAAAFAGNVPANHLLKVKPPANPPSIATSWGLAVVRATGAPANAANVTVQSQSGKTAIPLANSWTSPTTGPTTTGGQPPAAAAFSQNAVWSSNSAVSLTKVSGSWPTTYTYPTIGGYYYQFYLTANNNAGSARTIPIVYFCPGTAPSTGGSTTGGTGEGGSSIPLANIAAQANVLNAVNASATVNPLAASVIDWSAVGADLGYLGTANGAPYHLAQVQMPAYYRSGGFPTGADYLLSDASTLVLTSTAPPSAYQPAVVDPTTITTGADMRFLAAHSYSQSAGTWDAYATTGSYGVTLQAGTVGVAPYYAPANDNQAFFYQYSDTQNIAIPSLLFDSGIGTWLYSDAVSALNLPEYTLIMALSLANRYEGVGGLWSSCPTAGGGGPDTTVDPSGVNYRALSCSGSTALLEAYGMANKGFEIGNGPLIHKPMYLAVRFRNDSTFVAFAQDPASVTGHSMTLAASGNLNGTVVLGADAIQGLASGSFNLFELGLYFRSMAANDIVREMQLMAQVYR